MICICGSPLVILETFGKGLMRYLTCDSLGLSCGRDATARFRFVEASRVDMNCTRQRVCGSRRFLFCCERGCSTLKGRVTDALTIPSVDMPRFV